MPGSLGRGNRLILRKKTTELSGRCMWHSHIFQTAVWKIRKKTKAFVGPSKTSLGSRSKYRQINWVIMLN